MKQVRDNDQPALMDMVEAGNGKYICIWNMAGWWYKLTEYDDATQTHSAIGKTYGSLEEAKAAAEEFAGAGMVSDSKKVKDGIWNQADTENFKKELNAALQAVGSGVRQGEGGLQFTFDALDSALESMGYEYEREFRPWGEDAGFEYSNGSQTLKFFLRMANRNERRTFYYMPIHGGLDIHDSKPSISDSKKIKDENTADVLDGHLALSFKEGTEEETYKAIQGHANESGELDGVQYETYEVNDQDGVAIIDMCAATDDPNNFVKALLKKWGVIKNIADMKFQASEEMKEAQKEENGDQVSDSRKIEDEIKLTKNASGDGKNDVGVAFKYKGERKLNKSEVAELDKVVKDWSKEKFGEVIFDSRRIKDNEVNVEEAVYDAIMEASPAVQDAIVEIARDNYDLSEFESTEDLSNTIWNDIDYLASQLPEDLREDFADTYGF